MSSAKTAPRLASAPDRKELERAIDKIGWRIKELRMFDLGGIQERWDPRLERMQAQVNTVLSDALGQRSAEYKQYAIGPLGAELDSLFGDRYSTEELRETVRKGIEQAVHNLNAVTALLEQRLDGGAAPAPEPSPEPPVPTAAPTPAPAANPTPAATPAPTAAPKPAPTVAPTPQPTPEPKAAMTAPATAPASPTAAPRTTGRRVAVICRLDDATRDGISAFLTQLGLDPVPVTPGEGGGSLIARVDGLRDLDFAVVAMSSDDSGGGSGDLLEIGYLLGALGSARVCFVLGGKAAPAASMEGFPRHAMDEGGLWRLLLAREMKQAGLDVDLNRAL